MNTRNPFTRSVSAGAVLAVGTMIAACSAPMECPAAVQLGGAISVEPLDAETGAYIAGMAEGRIVRGSFEEEMHRLAAPPPYEGGDPPDPPYPYRFLLAVGNGPGLYSVYVEAPGYESWEQHGVFVESAGECGGIEFVKTRKFVPALVPLQ